MTPLGLLRISLCSIGCSFVSHPCWIVPYKLLTTKYLNPFMDASLNYKFIYLGNNKFYLKMESSNYNEFFLFTLGMKSVDFSCRTQMTWHCCNSNPFSLAVEFEWADIYLKPEKWMKNGFIDYILLLIIARFIHIQNFYRSF